METIQLIMVGNVYVLPYQSQSLRSKKLSLGRNKITDEGVKHLVQSLGESNSTHLNLSCNKITDDGVTQLASFLSTSPCKLSY